MLAYLTHLKALNIFILAVLLAIPLLEAAPGTLAETRLPSRVSRELTKIPEYREGAKAMAGILPDVAVGKFQAALGNKKLSTRARPYVTLALSEALIRSSTSPQGQLNQAEAALKLLNDKSLAQLPATPVWRAEALASLGRFKEANDALASITTKHPLYSEIQLARARLLTALNRIGDALHVLAEAAKSKSSKISNAANLHAAEIHIDHTRFELALKSLEKIDSQNASATKLKEYLNARLTLAEGNFVDAINRFQSLITAPEELGRESIFHACILGLADAQAENNLTDAAIATLEQYITEHPDSPSLQAAFTRLTRLLSTDLPDDHPSMAKLRTWSAETPLADNSPYVPGDSLASIRPFQPAPSEHDDLVTLALYHRAQLLARSEKKTNHTRAMTLLARLRSLHPAHSLPPTELYLKLSSASLLDTAYLHLKQGNPTQATFTLSVMEKVAFSPRLKDQASFLRGLLLAADADFKTSHEAFKFARQSTSEDISSSANINAGITALKASNLTAFNKILSETENTRLRNSLLLERSLWKCSQLIAEGRNELDTFILNHPNHPRENEARMALAAASVNINPPDINLAKAQLEIISPRLIDSTNQLSITRIRIHAEKLANQWQQAADTAALFIQTFPDNPNIPVIMLEQGEAYYHNEDYNKARRTFQDIAKKYPESKLIPYARFFEAMAARLGGTPQSRDECIILFQKIIDTKHPLAAEARIQQSRVLIDLRRYSEAETCLKPLLATKKTPSAQRLAGGVLMADCLHRQGSANPEKYAQAITIYNDLLKAENLPPAWKNRLHFLRGQTYEGMTKTREAFNSYYNVIIRANVPPRDKEEWFWFYRCGFKALSMLENAQRWEAAVKLARHIASFNGPRAEEASKRANSLAKKHMIWEDEDPTPADTPAEQP